MAITRVGPRAAPVPQQPKATAQAPAPRRADPPKVQDGFLWGSAIAGYQAETGLHNTDWYQWEQSKGIFGMPHIAHGDQADLGPDFAHLNPDGTPGGHFREYLAAAKAMGQNSFRFSLEWSRIQPTKDGPYDPNALRLYHAILDECAKDGLKPLVTLQHFDLPTWVNDVSDPAQGMGGWAGAADSVPGKAPIVDAFAKFAGDMAREFGGQVDTWITLNEPTVFDITAYGVGAFPGPGRPDLSAMKRAMINMAYAHARAYDAIKANDTVDADGDGLPSQVGIAQHVRIYEPLNPSSEADKKAAAQMSYFANSLILDAATSGDVDWNADGRFDGPGEGHALPDLRNRLDFVGINYYSRDKVAALPFPIGPKDMKLDGIPVTEIPFIGRLFQSEPTTDNGWEIHPQGMYDALMWAANRFHRPIVVTENGIADKDVSDAKRPQFILDHIEQMQRAMKDGADVRGYQYWSLMDNFEWTNGFGPRFGLLHVNYDDPNRSFSETTGAQAYSDVIRNGGVTRALHQRWDAPGNSTSGDWLASTLHEVETIAGGVVRTVENAAREVEQALGALRWW